MRRFGAGLGVGIGLVAVYVATSGQYVATPGIFTRLTVSERAGIGTGFTTATLLDVRNDASSGLDMAEFFDYRDGVGGTGLLIGRGRGTVAAPLALQSGDSHFQIRMYGYDSNNAVQESARLLSTVDRAPTAGLIPANFRVMLIDTAIRDRLRIDSAGHWIAPVGAASPVASACGTTPTVAGSDVSGRVTIGTLGTGCTITWDTSYTTASPGGTANCIVASEIGNDPFTWSITSTALTLTAVTTGRTYRWLCIGF